MAAAMMGKIKQGVQNVVGQGRGHTLPPVFQTELTDCMGDNKVCMQTFFCLWCTESNMYNKLDNNVGQFDCGLCAFFTGAFLCTRGWSDFMVAAGARRTLMRRYGIQEAYSTTCLNTTFCFLCSHCQVQREMKVRGIDAGGVCVGDSITDVGNEVANVVGLGGKQRGQKYSTEMFSCAGKECVDGFFCYPCVLGKMMTKLNDVDGVADKERIPDGGKAPFDFCECIVALFAPQEILYGMRREFIGRYGIGDSDALTDCMWVTFCTPCALCQMQREMGIRGHWPGGMLQEEMPEGCQRKVPERASQYAAGSPGQNAPAQAMV